MRNNPDYSLTMAMLVTDSDRPSPKVWQPWYIDETDGVRKELPTRVLRDQRMKERMALHHKPSSRRTLSPLNSSDEEEIDVGVPPPSHAGSYSYAYLVESAFDEDAPLDMSTKRRSPPPAHTPTPPLHPPSHMVDHAHTPPPSYVISLQPPPPPAHTPSSASPPPYLSRAAYPLSAVRGRPTVITCASPIYLPPFSPSHEPSSGGSDRPYGHAGAAPPSYPDRYAPPPPYNIAAAQLREKMMVLPPAEPSSNSPTPETVRKISEGNTEEAKRQVVQAGPVDPEIDEHFRRSLGRNYQELFITENSSESQPESSDSVDDHFAKALGETWTKLKAKGRDRGSSNSAGLNSSITPYIRSVSSSSSVSPLRNSTPPSLTPITLSRIPPLHSVVTNSSNRSSPSSADTLIIQGSNEVSITRIPSTYCPSTSSTSYSEVPLSLTSKLTPT